MRSYAVLLWILCLLFLELPEHPSVVLAQSDETCTSELEANCAQCNFWGDSTGVNGGSNKVYNCSLPGLEAFRPGGQYEGVQANYLSYLTEISTPFFPDRALEFEACTGGRIVFSEANNIFTDPIEDLGTITNRGSEVYDGYFMSYSHFPEVSALKLSEPLNDRIRQDIARLKWEDVFPKVKAMGEYRHADGEKALEFLMYDGDFFVPVVRLDLLEQHGLPLPNTWEEVIQYVQFFNGTDLNGDGVADDFGFCHFPRLGAGIFDWWWAEAMYGTWASTDQSKGSEEGFFFDEDTMDPRIGEGFGYAAKIWKELWNSGTTSESDVFLEGRCAVGLAPPGSWKRLFLTPNGVHRADENGTVVWQPKMKNGDYAEPYRFKTFGSLQVVDRTTGALMDCTKELCPKAEKIPARGHFRDNDRASVLPPSPLEGKLINRVPFYWSGGLGTMIRKSAPKVRKDLLWDFFVYTNSPQTSVHDVANYRSWLDSWRYSQLVPGANFVQAGWSRESYSEHNDVMQWALSKDANGAFNLRLPGLVKYTRDVAGEFTRQYIDGDIELDELLFKVDQGWREITDQEGKLEQLSVYRGSLGLEAHTEVELCRLHRELMDQRDPSICRKYDETSEATILLAVLIPVAAVVFALLVFIFYERKRRKDTDLVWKIEASELHFDDPPRILGKGTFGYVLKAEYRGTAVAVKRFATDRSQASKPAIAGHLSPIAAGDIESHSQQQATNNLLLRSFSNRVGSQPQVVPVVDQDGVPLAPSNMGQTMSAKHSKAMVKILKNNGRDKESKGSSGIGGATQLSDRDINRQRAEFVQEIKKLATLRHQCVITIMGAVMAKEDSMIVLEFMDHGSLYDLLHNETMEIDGEILLPILRDIASGVRFLHAATPQIVHCDLKASNILVDSRFRAKVADFGLSTIDASKTGAAGTPYFLSPEILRGETGNTAESDAYAFGILIYEVYARADPYLGENPLDVLCAVADKEVNKRPSIPPSCPPKAETLMIECLNGDPRRRPTFEELDLQLKRLATATLEPLRLHGETKKEEQAIMLYELFPKHVADALNEGRKVEPQSRENCTIFSSKIFNFDELSSSLGPVKVADMLQRLYEKFDKLCLVHDVYRVETVNDAYMGVTGLVKDQPDHAKRIADFSIAAVKAARATLIDEEDPGKGSISILAGFSSGSVVATVMGTQHPRYCLFGDAVAMASKMEQCSLANRIQCSEVSAMLLEHQAPSIPIRTRGLMNIKGTVEAVTFFVNEKKEQGDLSNRVGEGSNVTQQ